jgi:hypothetical protein
MKKLVLGLLVLTPAFAFAVPGPYATVQAGVNTVNVSNASQTSTVGFAGGAAAGYLWGDNTWNYGLEADGVVYPNSNSSKRISPSPVDSQTSYDGYNLSLLGVLKYTCCKTGLTAFVKGGGAYVDQQLTYNSSTYHAQNTFAPEAAIGVGYMFSPNLEVDLTADRVFAEDQSTANFNAGNYKVVENDNYLLGLTYHFA